VGICNFLIGLALIASGRPGVVLHAAIPEAVINITANLILIPRFGMFGAAAASVISRSAANPIFLLQLPRAQAWPTAVCYLRPFMNAGIAYASLLALAPLGPWAKVISLCVFMVITLCFGGLQWADVTFGHAGIIGRSATEAR
jgi:O-antigen/teichoic acid export membrane protein